MASTEKSAPETEVPERTRYTNLFIIDLSLRVLLFASTVVAIVLIPTSKQTEIVRSVLQPIPAPRAAKFSHSPALIYFLVAVCVACFYSIVSILASFSAISKPVPSKGLLLTLAFLDALMVGIMASALGAGSSVAYVGLKGNSHVGWSKVCNVYDKFCRHVAGYLAMGLVASIVLVLLVMISTYSLYKRSS